jgi:glycosyltransferase involved in cell wall biosynthesis
MQILYYHLYFNTRHDTSGTRSYEMAQRLIQRGHSVTMVCGSRKGKLDFQGEVKGGYKYGKIDGINVVEIQIPLHNYGNFLLRGFAFLVYGIRGIKLALTLKYDLLFATSTPLTAGIPGIIMKMFRRKAFVFEVRDLWPELPKEMGVIRNPLVLGTMSILEWLTYRSADSCIGLSPGIVEGIRKRSRKSLPVTMIPNGCDLDVFKPGDRQDLRLDGINGSNFVAVFTGAHGIANGLDAVLDVAAYLKKINRVEIIFAFIGAGIKKMAIIERAKQENLDNCKFYDPIQKINLSKVTGSADVGLMILANVPAFYYGTSPNKFFDYIASGLPVLNNYPGWLADMIREYRCGVCVDPENPKAFADGLIWLAENPEERRIMGINARKLAETKFNRDVLAEDFIEWLKTTANDYYGSR